MPVDYAIGVRTFIPNDAVLVNDYALKLIAKAMEARGIRHTTSECTLRGFTCPIANVDPKTSTPLDVMRAEGSDGISGRRRRRCPGSKGTDNSGANK